MDSDSRTWLPSTAARNWLVAGGWWLVAGGWWLVAGGWWLVAGGSFSILITVTVYYLY